MTIAISSLPDGSLTIAIQDTGIGIASDECPRVFERFYRSAAARQRYNQGSGLGLAIVRSIMQLHGGEVTLVSESGQGSTVTLHFPRVDSISS
jgi:two-component system heavy metal sensor histidine kinase CusS